LSLNRLGPCKFSHFLATSQFSLEGNIVGLVLTGISKGKGAWKKYETELCIESMSSERSLNRTSLFIICIHIEKPKALLFDLAEI
jgi:hypothetical protein